MASNDDVVRYLNEVVDLGALSDNRIANSAPIDRCSSSNLNIVVDYNHTDLGHLEVLTCAQYEPKPVLSNVTTGVNNHSIANGCVGD